MYLNLPYAGHQTDKIRRELLSLLSRYFVQIQPMFYFRCDFTSGSFFRFRDSPEPTMRRSVVYKYACDSCRLSYIDSNAQKHPYLAVILRHISAMVPYPEVTVRKRFSKCTKQKFPCVRSPSGDTVKRAVDQSEASLQTKISCCMSTKTIACGEAWRNHPKRNVFQFYRRGAACSYSCSYF